MPTIRSLGTAQHCAVARELSRKPVVSERFGRYSEAMSTQTSELLDAFEALSVEEKRVFTAAFFKRAIPFDSGPLDDEETAHAADELFAMLDQEEDDAGSR